MASVGRGRWYFLHKSLYMEEALNRMLSLDTEVMSDSMIFIDGVSA